VLRGKAEIVQVCAGLRDMAGAQIVHAYEFAAWKVLGVQPGGAKVMQACAGLRGTGPVERSS
jgi:hypothetical protein